MTVAEIEARVDEIASEDNETAHVDEDQLYIDVLEAIAGGAPNAADLAKAALEAATLDYERWYA